MDPSTASDIETERPAAGRAERTVVEIGPYDLPEPAGGWVELFQADDRDEGEHGSVAGAAAAPRDGPAARDAAEGAGRAPSPPPPRARSWVLLPEAIVVAAFVALGALFAGALILFRGPAAPPARSAVSAPAEPAPSAGRRLPQRRTPPRPRTDPGPYPAPDGLDGLVPSPSADLDAAAGGESPLDPEAPPPASLAPFHG